MSLTEKQITDLGVVLISSIDTIRNMHYEPKGIPNRTIISDDHCIININFGPRAHNLFLSTNVYLVDGEDYMAEYILYSSQPDFIYPENSTEESMEFSIKGAPYSNVYTFGSTLEAVDLHAAIDDAFSFVTNNVEDILRGFAGLGSQATML